MLFDVSVPRAYNEKLLLQTERNQGETKGHSREGKAEVETATKPLLIKWACETKYKISPIQQGCVAYPHLQAIPSIFSAFQ